MTLIKRDAAYFAAVQAELDPVLEAARKRRLARSPEQEERLTREIMDLPVDPDIEAISEYLDFELPDDEMAAMEDRLENDAEFRRKVAPLVWMWETPISFTPPSERPGPATKKATAWKTSGESIEFVAAKPIKRWMRWIIALAIIVPLLMGGVVWLAVQQMRAALSTSIYARGSANGGLSPDRYFLNPIRYSATEANKIVEPRPDVRIELIKGGHLIVRGENQDKLTWAFPAAALDGDAIVELGPKMKRLVLATPGGMVSMTPGRYAISCRPGCTEARVTIESGKVNGTGGVAFTDGLVLVRDMQARRATDTTGFLKLTPKK